jgi:hypothetical protein
MRSATTWLPLEARRSVFFTVHRKLGGHLRLFASGGAPLASETQQLWERLGVRVVQGYGTVVWDTTFDSNSMMRLSVTYSGERAPEAARRCSAPPLGRQAPNAVRGTLTEPTYANPRVQPPKPTLTAGS